jgi:hypothetical protein
MQRLEQYAAYFSKDVVVPALNMMFAEIRTSQSELRKPRG